MADYFTTNPATGKAYTQDEVNAMGGGGVFLTQGGQTWNVSSTNDGGKTAGQVAQGQVLPGGYTTGTAGTQGTYAPAPSPNTPAPTPAPAPASMTTNTNGAYNMGPAPAPPPTSSSTSGTSTSANPLYSNSRMKNDWSAYFRDTAAGDTRNWGGGTLTKMANGSANYVYNGQSRLIDANSNIAELAGYSPELAAELLANYGGDPAPGAAGANGGANGAPGSTTATGSGGGFNLANLNTGNPTVQGPTDWTVNANQTVANQLEQILRSDSPLMQQARTRALQRAQADGRTNTSMAASAGEAAMIDAAMPVATADASTYGRAGEFNAGNRNTFTRDANAYSRDRAMADFNLAANDWAAGRSAERGETAAVAAAGRDNARADRDFNLSQRGADANLGRETQLATTNAGLNATSSSTAEDKTLQRGYVNAINSARSDYAAALTNISASSTMTSEVKAETLRNLRTTYNTIITNYSRLLGWDAASWVIGDEPASAAAATPAPGTTPAGGGNTYNPGEAGA